MRSKMVRRSLLVAGLLAVPLLASCSSTSDQVSDEISSQVKDKLDLSTEPEVTCPDDAKAEKGASFECTITLEGTTIPVKVKFKDDTNFESTVQGAVYKKAVLEKGLTDQLAASNVSVASIDCPGKALVVMGLKDTVDCAAVDTDGAKATLTVGLNDDGEATITNITEDK